MADDSASPLLGVAGPSSQRSMSRRSRESDESTPLISHTSSNPQLDGGNRNEEDPSRSPAASFLRLIQEGRFSPRPPKNGRRWPTVVAIVALGTIAIAIMIGVFFAPAVIEQYAKQSLVIEPKSLSLDSFTPTGVRARIQADFRLEASRVKNDAIRNLGRAGTWIAREVESKETQLKVYLPEYGNILVGTAVVPSVIVNVQSGHTTHVDFHATLEPGDLTGIKGVVNDWLGGRLGQLRVQGKAEVALKSGIFPLGTQSISESLTFEGNDIPAMPKYKIMRLNFHEVQIPMGQHGMAADVSLSVVNSYPVSFQLPPLGFNILVPNCAVDQPYILLADATTEAVAVEPNSIVKVDVGGIIREIPDTLTTACPGSDSSPLDILLGDYIHGNDTKLFVRGSNAPESDTPKWIADFISSVTIPVPFPGHSFDDLVRNFSLTDVHFGLPDPFAQPGSPESNPMVSGNIEVLAGLPKEMNFGVNVSRVRATADVYYKGDKLGYLNLRKWQPAKSKRLDLEGRSSIRIESQIKNAPLYITNDDVFDSVIGDLVFGGKSVLLTIDALVDVAVGTVLGEFIVRDVPGKGNVPVKPIPKSGLSNLKPHVGDLRIYETGKTALSFQAKVNFTNPSEYTAQIPYVNVHIMNNGSVLGQATIKNTKISNGNNTNILVEAVWDPSTLGGKKAQVIGRNFLSQYISGWNTTITLATHKGSIPSQPGIGEALSKFKIEIPTPRLSTPQDNGDEDDSDRKKPRFIRDATFHLLSSTATFSLISPLQYSDIYIENINATAYYNHTEPVGMILYDLPFKVPPGISQTPKLPVNWSLDSIGYDKLRKALGGELKLDAQGTVKIRLGKFREEVWYIGHGIGARVTI